MRGGGAEAVGHVGEIDLRHVIRVNFVPVERTVVINRIPKVRLRIGSPADVLLFKKCGQMLLRSQVVIGGQVVRKNAEVRPSLEPKVVRKAGVILRRIKVSLRVSRSAKEFSVDVRGQDVALD